MDIPTISTNSALYTYFIPFLFITAICFALLSIMKLEKKVSMLISIIISLFALSQGANAYILSNLLPFGAFLIFIVFIASFTFRGSKYSVKKMGSMEAKMIQEIKITKDLKKLMKESEKVYDEYMDAIKRKDTVKAEKKLKEYKKIKEQIENMNKILRTRGVY